MLSQSRADELKKVELDEMETIAKTSLNYIEKSEERGEDRTGRRSLYFGSAGERQSLLYKQIWDPFNDDQHGDSFSNIWDFLKTLFSFIEVVLAALTQWHLSKGVKDEHYMWNVTLPGIVQLYT